MNCNVDSRKHRKNKEGKNNKGTTTVPSSDSKSDLVIPIAPSSGGGRLLFVSQSPLHVTNITECGARGSPCDPGRCCQDLACGPSGDGNVCKDLVTER